jgi:hypothetical protein
MKSKVVDTVSSFLHRARKGDNASANPTQPPAKDSDANTLSTASGAPFPSTSDQAEAAMNLGDDDLQLLCVIEGESEVFPIDVEGSLWRNPKFTVGHLKETIQGKRKNDSLAGVGAHILVLWKVRATEESRSWMIWLTCHLCSPKRGILSMRNRNRLSPDG